MVIILFRVVVVDGDHNGPPNLHDAPVGTGEHVLSFLDRPSVTTVLSVPVAATGNFAATFNTQSCFRHDANLLLYHPINSTYKIKSIRAHF